jgi:hypothetical protein
LASISTKNSLFLAMFITRLTGIMSPTEMSTKSGQAAGDHGDLAVQFPAHGPALLTGNKR